MSSDLRSTRTFVRRGKRSLERSLEGSLGRTPDPRVLGGGGRARRRDVRGGPGRQRHGDSRVRFIRGARRDVGPLRRSTRRRAWPPPRRIRSDAPSRTATFGADRRDARGGGSHFVAVTTAGAWSASPGKDGDDRGAAAALDFVVERLGGDAATRAVGRDACARAPGQQSGIAILAACGPGGVRSRAWAGAGGSAKARGAVALSSREMCRRAQNGSRSRPADGSALGRRFGRAFAVAFAVDVLGGEPWFGVPEWSAEETRVSRHASTLRDFRAAFLGKPDAFAGAGDVAEEDDDASSGARVDVHATAKTLLAYVSAKYTAARWCPARRLRDAYRTDGRRVGARRRVGDARGGIRVDGSRARRRGTRRRGRRNTPREARPFATHARGRSRGETSAESESAEDRTEVWALRRRCVVDDSKRAPRSSRRRREAASPSTPSFAASGGMEGKPRNATRAGGGGVRGGTRQRGSRERGGSNLRAASERRNWR